MSDDGTVAVDARLKLKCEQRGHLITTLWQTGPGADLQEMHPPPVRRWRHENNIFEKSCPECEMIAGHPVRYARPVDSIRQKMSEVPKGTVGEWTLVYLNVADVEP